ncbi:MAG: H-NS histone family protein [Acidobacteriia bacterium]|nr:H-NS histone family protein [Terriglobia bacterium]
MLNELDDEELQAVISGCNGLLQQRDRERKNKALEDARAILATAGLNLKDVANGKAARNGAKAPTYHGGHTYQHPSDKTKVWNARGQKPGWVRALEAKGRRAIEVVPANDNSAEVQRPAQVSAAIKKVG